MKKNNPALVSTIASFITTLAVIALIVGLGLMLNAQKDGPAPITPLPAPGISSLIASSSPFIHLPDEELLPLLQGPMTFAGEPLPQSTANYEVLKNNAYEVGYSDDREDPLWSAYHLAESMPMHSDRSRPPKFLTDERTLAKLAHKDFTQHNVTLATRFDRGHMTPNFAIGTRYEGDAQLQTFLLSNICPQEAKLNEQTWAAAEHKIATQYTRDFGNIWVTVGPIFGPNPQRLNDKAQIPDAFYMVVVGVDPAHNIHLLAFEMAQSVQGEHSLHEFVKTAHTLETQTGLAFFPQMIPDHRTLLETLDANNDPAWATDQELKTPSREKTETTE